MKRFHTYMLFVFVAWLVSTPMNCAGLRITAETESLATVCGCVNVTSGDFFMAKPDLLTNGPTPQCHACLYDSGLPFDSPICGYATGFHHPLLVTGLYVEAKRRFVASMQLNEREGFSLPYLGNPIHHGIEFYIDPDLFTRGYTNYSELGLSGRTNIRNRKATYYGFGKHHTWGQFEVTDGSGRKRYYEPFKHEDGCTYWRLAKEIKPNGHHVHFEYWNCFYLKSVKTTNPTGTLVYHTLEYSADPVGYKVIASNGHKTTYSRRSLSQTCFNGYGRQSTTRTCGTGVDSTQGIAAQYQIAGGKLQHVQWKINRISYSDERFLDINYSDQGKVLSLCAPVGTGNTPIPIA